jgi:type I restriction enzyme, S subunit
MTVVGPEGCVVRLKHVARSAVSNVDKKSAEGEVEVRLCNYTDVYYNASITPELPFMNATARVDQIKQFRLLQGDSVITKDSETPDDIAVPAYVAASADDVVCGYHLAIVRPDQAAIDPRFLYWTLSSTQLRSWFASEATGVTRFGLRTDSIANAPIFLPPRRVQQRIAAFLDAETARIDALIQKKQRLAELVLARHTVVISQVVKRGLDPNVETQDSAMDWIGPIPLHWQAKKIKWLCRVRRGASPRPIDDPVYFDDEGDYAWVRISDVTAAGRYLRKTQQRLSFIGSTKSVKLEPGTLFLSIAGSVGKPVITKIKCCIHDGFVYFDGLKENAEFLYYVLSSGDAYGGLGKLGTQLNLNTDTVGDIRVPVPPPDEQEAIVSVLDVESEKVGQLVSILRRQMQLLNERRFAVVAAAVAGDLDVSVAA